MSYEQRPWEVVRGSDLVRTWCNRGYLVDKRRNEKWNPQFFSDFSICLQNSFKKTSLVTINVGTFHYTFVKPVYNNNNNISIVIKRFVKNIPFYEGGRGRKENVNQMGKCTKNQLKFRWFSCWNLDWTAITNNHNKKGMADLLNWHVKMQYSHSGF